MTELSRFLKRIANTNPQIKALSVKAYEDLLTMNYRLAVSRTLPDTKLVFFESYLGRKYSCSPRAFYEAMLQDPRYGKYRKIWAFTEPEKHRDLVKKDPDTVLVRYGSREYYRYLASAGYIISNYGLPHGVRKRPGQVYVQTWHGTPLKKIGCDVPRQNLSRQEREYTDRKYRAEGRQIDYMPSPSPFYSETVKRAFRLGRQATLLEYGYPRNDSLFTAREEDIARIRKKLSIPEGKKIILYAPTWRQEDHVAGEGYVYRPALDFQALYNALSGDALILFRTHYFIRENLDLSAYKGFLLDVSDYDEVNELYLISDLLITDYSSVFFDYANLWRPILFYMYDYESYREEMEDFYIGIDRLPGPVIKERRDISEDIKELLDHFVPDEKYREFNRDFNPCNRPCAAEMLEEIFDGI